MNEGVTGGEEVAQSVPEIPAPISDKMMYDELMANDPYFKQNEMLQHTLGKIFTPELLDVRIREEVVQKHRLELQMRYDYYLRNKDLADYAQGGVNQNLSPAALEDLKPSAEQVIEAKAAVDQQKAAAVEAPLQAAHVTTQEPELAAPSEPAQQSVPEVVASPVAEPLVRQEIHKSGVKAKGVETTSDDGYMFQVLFTSDPGFVNNVELMKELSVLVDPNLAREAPEAAILEARRKLTEYYQKFIGVRPTAAPMPQEPAKQPASEFPKPAPEKPRNSAENKQKLNDFSLAEKQSEAKSYYIVLGVKNDHTFSLATLQSKYRALQKKTSPRLHQIS